jgi:hypothetical protein
VKVAGSSISENMKKRRGRYRPYHEEFILLGGIVTRTGDRSSVKVEENVSDVILSPSLSACPPPLRTALTSKC